MSETAQILPAELVDSLNQDQKTIEDTEFEEIDSSKDPDFDFSSFQEDPDFLDEKPDFLDDAEQGDSSGFEIDEIEGLSDAFVDFCKFGKDLLSDYYESAFVKKVKKEFSEEMELLNVVLLADQEDKLSLDGLSQTLKTIQSHSTKFNHIEFAQLVPVYTTFRRVKKRYTAKPLQPYQEEGLRRYFKLTMIKYFQSQSADPLAMLIIYLMISFGYDGYNLYQNFRDK